MDISYYKSLEPIFGSWYITRLIGEGSFGKVFEIEKKDERFGKCYKAALKVISIPQSSSEITSLRSEGMSEADVTDYFRGIVGDVINEYDLMAKLKGNSHIVSCEDYIVVDHEDGMGWDILIRMELLQPLVKALENAELSEGEVIKLGVDLCRALESCQKYNIIHRDIKPENIFISELGEYKLGDFGIARTQEKTTSAMSRKGTCTYMAPEIYNGQSYGKSVDIYSIGLVMYRLLNKNRAPFFPEFPKPISYADKENALMRRMKGEPITRPINGSDELIKVVMKACSYASNDRYSNPEDMRRALEALEGKSYESFANEKTDIFEDEKTETILKNIVDDEKTETLLKNRVTKEEKTESLLSDEDEKTSTILNADKAISESTNVMFEKEDSDKTLSVYSSGNVYDSAVINEIKEDAKPKKKSGKAWIFILVAVLAIAGIVAVVVINKSKSSKKMTMDEKIMEFIECSSINGKSIMTTDNITDYLDELIGNAPLEKASYIENTMLKKTNIKNGVLAHCYATDGDYEYFDISDSGDANAKKWISFDCFVEGQLREYAYIMISDIGSKSVFGLDQYLSEHGYKSADDIVRGLGLDVEKIKSSEDGLRIDTETGKIAVSYSSYEDIPYYNIVYYNGEELFGIDISEVVMNELDEGVLPGRYISINMGKIVGEEKERILKFLKTGKTGEVTEVKEVEE